MGDVNCFVCERVLSQHKFVFKCRICQRDFDDVAQVLEHYSDTNYEYLKCEGSHSSSFNVAAVKKEEPEVAISDEPPFEPIQELLDNNDLDLADWDDSLELKWSGSDKKRSPKVPRCKVCRQIFETLDLLHQHEEEQEQCPDCGHFYRHKDKKSHVDSEHPKDWHCQPCNMTFDSGEALRIHFKRHHGIGGGCYSPEFEAKMAEAQNDLRCFTCQNRFETSLELKEHHEQRDSCPHCPDTMTHDRVHEHLLVKHNASITCNDQEIKWERDLSKEASSRFYCSSCNRSFKRLKLFKLHFWGQHDITAVFTINEGNSFQKKKIENATVAPSIVCDLCGLSMKPLSLKKHKQVKHGLGKLYQCESCDFQTRNRNGFVVHLKRIHNIGYDRSKVCLICGYTHLDTAGIKSHVLKMHGQAELERWINYDWSKHNPDTHVFPMMRVPKPTSSVIGELISCTQCGKEFDHKKKLYQHMKRHRQNESNTVFSCRFCSMTTRHQKSLDRHYKRKHPGHESEWYSERCNQCQKTFPTTTSLMQHLSKAHNSQEAKKWISEDCRQRQKNFYFSQNAALPQ